MKYVLEVEPELQLRLEIYRDDVDVLIDVCDTDGCKSIYLDSDELFELIGVLSHLRKQIQQNQ